MDTNAQIASPTQFYFTIENVEGINHVVVFLTGQTPFSDGFAGGIYFGWPMPTGEVGWHYLGYISNDKPSAIFKIANIKSSANSQNPFGQAMIDGLGGLSATTALIAVSVEPVGEIVQQTPVSNSQASTADSFTEFTQKMLENFFNYISSFAFQSPVNPAETYVPLPAVQQWFENFQRRLQANPNFWK